MPTFQFCKTIFIEVTLTETAGKWLAAQLTQAAIIRNFDFDLAVPCSDPNCPPPFIGRGYQAIASIVGQDGKSKIVSQSRPKGKGKIRTCVAEADLKVRWSNNFDGICKSNSKTFSKTCFL